MRQSTIRPLTDTVVSDHIGGVSVVGAELLMPMQGVERPSMSSSAHSVANCGGARGTVEHVADGRLFLVVIDKGRWQW